MEANKTLRLKIRQIRLEASGIHSYELVAEEGAPLPAFSAGSHLDIHLPSGLIRQYSLCNDPAEQHRYVIGVLRDERGRGGSKELHQLLQVGATVLASHPRNHFHLDESAPHVVLLAGGIGITPLKSMAHRLRSLGTSFTLHYCARGLENIAFAEELKALAAPQELQLHLDGGNPDRGLDIAATFAQLPKGSSLYYCGPTGFMAACAEAAQQYPDHPVYCEHFAAPVTIPVIQDPQRGARFIEIHSTGQRIAVNPGESLVDALGDAGIEIPVSCQSGLCGTCKTAYLSGDVEHADCILSQDEQMQFLTPCCSQIRGGTLVLDL